MTQIARLLAANEGYAAARANVAGLVYDVESGEIDDVVRWERPAGSGGVNDADR